MKILLAAVLALMFTAPAGAAADNLEGNFLYKVSTIRAAPGSLQQLLDWAATLEASTFFKDAGYDRPFLMRHSQGDQWDLLVITPMSSWQEYYDDAAVTKRGDAVEKHASTLSKVEGMIAFDEDVFAFGPALEVIDKAYARNSFFHVEMFNAAPGKESELLEQRRMENSYLKATGQTENLIFRRAAGSDVDVFTIGFHRSLEAFAAPGDSGDNDKEQAAINAGFKDRADISYYLRSLISSHNDTLATRVN